MCGIYASYSKNAAKKVLLGLKRIEYRGYDSWGIASLKSGNISVRKQIGKLSNLKDIVFEQVDLSLGHTRWATHGGVTKINAHPHLAKNKSFALVQNGVVENYQDLKEKLISAGYEFVSETDTEIIVGLLEQEMEKKAEKTLNPEIFAKVFQNLSGRNTIAVITNDGRLMAIRHGSPLLVGKNSRRDYCFSSDILSMSDDMEEYIIVDSGEMVSFNCATKEFVVTNIETKMVIVKKFAPIDHRAEVSEKNEFGSYMLKEIHEQATVLPRVVSGLEKNFLLATKMLKDADQIFTLACGSASFATGNTAYLLRKAGYKASAIEAYEADSYLNLFNKYSVCIVYSQSGETADTNEIVELMKKKGAKIISVVNMPGSTLTQMSDLSFMLRVGPELAVASTKAFFGQVLWGTTIYDILTGLKFNDIEIKINEFEHKLKEWFSNNEIQKKIENLAKDLTKHEHLFVLGRGDLYYASLESALKLKEISYIHAEGFSGGELKHGVIALITKNTPVLCLVAEDKNKANMLNAISEVRARGGRTIVIAKQDNDLYSDWIQLPDTRDYIFLSSIIPSQLMTCYMAMVKGYDVDKPRNLAKSVTVK
ncbi:MAG: glutamine--fructose-6-phosphate transaminase (isomerizing) [Pseudomonadales bacterium]|nr:glutamine--fructose-6-phosphate transaminase (isomerizing) [Pseudomonadales bacterium]